MKVVGWGLVIETAGKDLQLGLLSDGKPVEGILCDEPNQHSEKLVVYVQQLLQKAALDWKEVRYAVYHQGPGSHTGLRIGLAAIKAWALSLNWAVYPVPLMRVLYERGRLENGNSGEIFTFWETRTDLWYGQLWSEKAPSQAALLSRSEWEKRVAQALWVGNHPSAHYYVEKLPWSWIAHAARTVQPLTTKESIIGLVPLYFREFIPTQRKG
ncbi:MAG: tRNA (adenosine(37)-N6)-threonylcarbamoyltransferase complex dimerization subunit type 1 TsaB [Bacteroidia bacterium]|nr:tRNA (adenosine(37)-N6)-threonylcarbamoyltransferase complex dimerization subunit type 1 TsaB [Bacteroidia bacterium]